MRNKIIELFKGNPMQSAIKFNDLNLPKFRTNQDLKDNDKYLKSGVEQVQELKKWDLIKDNTVMLDFGCGQGRIVNSLEYGGTRIEAYYGIDTDLRSIEWCNKWLACYDARYNFIHLPAYNARYNSKVQGLKELPFAEHTFDLVFLNSVFSHMLENDVKFYLSEFCRVLKKHGHIYLTAFIEENVPDVEENPVDYLSGSHGSLHRVRYNMSFFYDLVDRSGLEVSEFYYQHIERTKQSVVIASKK